MRQEEEPPEERYEDSARLEVLECVPLDVTELLDVGCYRGAFGAGIKAARPQIKVCGIEPDASAAAIATKRLDAVTVGAFPDEMPNCKFDCVVFNDVLEHLEDPWSALFAARALLRPGGTVIASIPNVRHITVLLPLAMSGEWTYKDSGILDRTHLRFFTKASMVDLFSRAGLDVREVRPIRIMTRGRVAHLLRLVSLLGPRTRKLREELLAERYVVVAGSS